MAGPYSNGGLPPRFGSSAELADHTDRIRQLAGVTDDENDRRSRSIICNAQETCSQCAKCGRALAADEPVWRENVSLGRSLFGGWRYNVAPVCERCKSDCCTSRPPQPCENCRRPVHHEDNWRCHRMVCCETCGRAARATAAR